MNILKAFAAISSLALVSRIRVFVPIFGGCKNCRIHDKPTALADHVARVIVNRASFSYE